MAVPFPTQKREHSWTGLLPGWTSQTAADPPVSFCASSFLQAALLKLLLFVLRHPQMLSVLLLLSQPACLLLFPDFLSSAGLLLHFRRSGSPDGTAHAALCATKNQATVDGLFLFPETIGYRALPSGNTDSALLSDGEPRCSSRTGNPSPLSGASNCKARCTFQHRSLLGFQICSDCPRLLLPPGIHTDSVNHGISGWSLPAEGTPPFFYPGSISASLLQSPADTDLRRCRFHWL